MHLALTGWQDFDLSGDGKLLDSLSFICHFIKLHQHEQSPWSIDRLLLPYTGLKSDKSTRALFTYFYWLQRNTNNFLYQRAGFHVIPQLQKAVRHRQGKNDTNPTLWPKGHFPNSAHSIHTTSFSRKNESYRRVCYTTVEVVSYR